MFSLARTLFSPGSAEDRSSLFVWFIDSMVRSDSSRACVSALWLCTFADRPRSLSGRGAPEVSRFSCMLFLDVRGFSDYAGPAARSRLSRYSRVAFPHQERVGVLVLRFSKLNSPAHRYPCLRFKRHLAMPPARLRAKMEALSLSCRTLSFPTTCRFNPALPD
jgi:hypothetical protein